MRTNLPVLATIFCGALFALPHYARASSIVVPNSALTPSTSLYTNSVGGVVVMTGGGNSPGVGVLSGRNDDGFSGPINLGFTFDFFGKNYTTFYINNNGNISFGKGIAAYTPNGPTGAPQPLIAPFFADVDTRNSKSGVVHLAQSANEDIITWDGVGYYDQKADKLDTFQLILRSSNYNEPVGEGQIGFFYTAMQWETGDASGGSNGFGGSPAAVGFGDGAGNSVNLAGSIKPNISSVVNDEHIWFDVTNTGVPTPTATTPEPNSLILIVTGVGAIIARRKSASLHA